MKHTVSFQIPGRNLRKIEVDVDVEALDLSQEMIPGTKAKGKAVQMAASVLRREGVQTYTVAGVEAVKG